MDFFIGVRQVVVIKLYGSREYVELEKPPMQRVKLLFTLINSS